MSAYLSGPTSEGSTTFHVDYYHKDKKWDGEFISSSKDVQTATGADFLGFGKTKSYEKNTSSQDENENPSSPEPYKVQITQGSPFYEETTTDYKQSGEKVKLSLVNIDVRLLAGIGIDLTLEQIEVPIGAGNNPQLNSNNPKPAKPKTIVIPKTSTTPILRLANQL